MSEVVDTVGDRSRLIFSGRGAFHGLRVDPGGGSQGRVRAHDGTDNTGAILADITPRARPKGDYRTAAKRVTAGLYIDVVKPVASWVCFYSEGA